KDRVGIPLPRSGVLVDQRHDTGESLNGNRHSVAAEEVGQRAVARIAGGAPDLRFPVGFAEQVEVSRNFAARENRDIGSISPSVVRNPGGHLPRGLSEMTALASASTGSSNVAKLARAVTIRLGIKTGRCAQRRVRAGIVPGGFRNVTQG